MPTKKTVLITVRTKTTAALLDKLSCRTPIIYLVRPLHITQNSLPCTKNTRLHTIQHAIHGIIMFLPKHTHHQTRCLQPDKQNNSGRGPSPIAPSCSARVLFHELDEALAVQLRGHAAELAPSPAHAFVPRFGVLHLGVHLLRFENTKKMKKRFTKRISRREKKTLIKVGSQAPPFRPAQRDER